jgi:hypothetical protein
VVPVSFCGLPPAGISFFGTQITQIRQIEQIWPLSVLSDRGPCGHPEVFVNSNSNPQMTPMKRMIAPGIPADRFSAEHWKPLYTTTTGASSRSVLQLLFTTILNACLSRDVEAGSAPSASSA